jgi:hypothetical protein
MKLVCCCLATLILSGCASGLLLPKTPGEKASGFSYIPLDPLPVYEYPDEQTCGRDAVDAPMEGYVYRDLLDNFADVAVRLSISSYDAKTGIAFGTSSFGVAGNSYQVVLDYVKTDNVPVPFHIIIQKRADGTRKYRAERLYRDTASTDLPKGGAIRSQTGASSSASDENVLIDSEYAIPVYVGVGLRLTADIEVLKGTVNLASLGSIAASVEAGRSTGSLTVQTLGISGEKIDSSLPLPSKLNQTTIENAILSLGSMKALIYGGKVRARVTGLYLPVEDGSATLVNLINSELAEIAIAWYRNCDRVAAQ